MDHANQTATSSDPEGKPAHKSRASRAVSHLSDEKQARKRAADRESQRALRQRAREKVEKLERRVEELSSSTTLSNELIAAKKRTLELERELDRLKSTLAGLYDEKSATQSINSQDLSGSKSFQNTAILQKPPPSIITCNVNDAQTTESGSVLPIRIDPKSSIKASNRPTKSPRASAVVRQRKRAKNDSQISRIQEPFGSDRSPSFVSTSFLKQPTINAWELPLYVRIPDGPVEQILYGMIQQQNALLTRQDNSQALAIGPRYPNINVLIVPDLSHLSHPVSRVICELVKRIPYRSFIDKLAALIVVYPLYQWQISRTYENYCAMPAFVRPGLVQRRIPHPVWMCGLGWPELRDHIITHQEEYNTEEFMYLFSANLNVNWKKEIQAAIRWGRDGVTGTPEFTEHARTLDNYSMDRPFAVRYPELEPFCRFTEYPGSE